MLRKWHGVFWAVCCKNKLRAEKCRKYFSGTQSKEVSLRFLDTEQSHLAADIPVKGMSGEGIFDTQEISNCSVVQVVQ